MGMMLWLGATVLARPMTPNPSSERPDATQRKGTIVYVDTSSLGNGLILPQDVSTGPQLSKQ